MRLFVLLFLVGCAPLSEIEVERREYVYQEAYEQYLRDQESCRLIGGVWYSRFHHSRHRKPTLHEMKSSGCVRI